MTNLKIKGDLVFTINCPYLNGDVFLRKEIWYSKIVPAHPEVSNRLDLIRQIILKDDLSILKRRKKSDPNKIALFKECPHLLPYNKMIKIAMTLEGAGIFIITTVHGVNNIPLDMEELR
jgi:hypothetical protein